MMKKHAIKLRITLVYTLAMTLFAVFIFIMILLFGRASRIDTSKKSLEMAAEKFSHAIEYDDEDGVMIDDDLEYISHGIYLSVYDEAFYLIEGKTPPGVILPGDFLQEIREQDNWLIYDSQTRIDGYGWIYIRAVSSVEVYHEEFQQLIDIALIALPGAIILSALLGYLVISMQFRPISNMIETADQIEKSGDLSGRINEEKASGELLLLAKSFNTMFAKLERSFENEKRFTSDASHELRTPAAVITAEAEYALENPAAANDSLHIILKESNKLSQLISALLLLARADAGRQKLHLEKVDLSGLFHIVADELLPRAEEKNIRIERHIEEELILEADETLMMRFLMNLLDNAVKYGKENGLVQCALYRENDAICGYVRDDGDGIAEEALEKIFERFYRSDQARHTDGHGLGLPIAAWIAEIHGGNIHAENDNGAVFRFRFPTK
ncbi:MAG: HAMP domain-containing protein [Christensenellaceae bacterium]|nr:HAMP domain-containing protein [Christensenellaceae bacterium]